MGCYSPVMPEYRWNPDKDELLRRNRGLSFHDVVYHLQHGGLLADIEHPNQQRYPHQRMYIVRIRGYVHVVPFYRRESDEFLITAFPHSRSNRRYSGPNGDDDEQRAE